MKIILAALCFMVVLLGVYKSNNKEEMSVRESVSGVKTLSVNVPVNEDKGFQEFAQKAVVYISVDDSVIAETSLTLTENGLSGSIENVVLGKEYLIEIVISDESDNKGYYGEVLANITSDSVVDIEIESLTGASVVNGKVV